MSLQRFKQFVMSLHFLRKNQLFMASTMHDKVGIVLYCTSMYYPSWKKVVARRQARDLKKFCKKNHIDY